MASSWTNSEQDKSDRERQMAKQMGISGEVDDNKTTDSLKPKEFPK